MIKSVYLAAPFPERATAQGVMLALEAKGFRVTSTWLKKDDQLDDAHARLDLRDIERSDALILLSPPGYANAGTGGRHVEFGYALACGLWCVVVGDRTNMFHYLSSVVICPTLDQIIPALTALKGTPVRG